MNLSTQARPDAHPLILRIQSTRAQLTVERTYAVTANDQSSTITIKVTNSGTGAAVQDVRIWLYTADNYVGTSDSLEQTIGNGGTAATFSETAAGTAGNTIRLKTTNDYVLFTGDVTGNPTPNVREGASTSVVIPTGCLPLSLLRF